MHTHCAISTIRYSKSLSSGHIDVVLLLGMETRAGADPGSVTKVPYSVYAY